MALAPVLLTGGCNLKPALSQPTSLLRMSTTIAYNGLNKIGYYGKWETVTGRHDGRFLGRSARSYRSNDCITLIFQGSRLRIYGVTGRKGGQGLVVMPPLEPQHITFRSANKNSHHLMYDSGLLPDGIHSASVIVDGSDTRTRGYVNLDEFDVTVADRAPR